MARAKKKPPKSTQVQETLPVKKTLFGHFVKAEDILQEEKLSIIQLASALNGVNLPPQARRLLAIKLLPGSAFLPISEKCRIAGVSRDYWYKVQANPKFRQACLDYSKKFMPAMELPEIIGTHAVKAKLGDLASARFIAEYAEQLKTVGDTNIVVVTQEEREKKLHRGMNRFVDAISNNK